MPVKIKVHELKQDKQKLWDENRDVVERCEKEKRSLNADEQTAVDARYAQIEDLAKRISQAERLVATEAIGHEDPSSRSHQPLPHEDPANARGHRFSLMKAIRQAASRGIEPLDGIELETSQEIARRSQKNPQGFFMPLGRSRRSLGINGRPVEQRTGVLNTTTGTGAIPTVLDTEWIELLRNQMRVMQAGAREIKDLQGKFAIPRQTAAATAYWVAESGAPTAANQTLDQVLFSPKTIGAFTDISRRFFELANVDDGEEFVKQDLTAILARGIDLAALNGSGASNQPLGILQNTGITAGNTVSLGTNGGAPTWSALVELHTIVSRGNAAGLGETAYIGNADVEGTLATTAKIGSTFPVFLLEDGKVYGRPFLASQQLPNNLTKGTGTALSPIVHGVWNQLILAYWSGVDILVDPYTGSSTGTVRVVALQDLDIQVRHNEAFSVAVDMISNQTQ